MSEWKEYKIKDLGPVVTGKTPSSKFPEEFGFDMPFITPSDYKYYGKWAEYSDRRLSKNGVKKLQNKILPIGSVLVTCIGSDMGKVVLNKVPVITNQQINSIIPNQKLVSTDFLYYKIIDCYETLRMYGQAGSAVPILNKGDFEDILLEVPEDIEEQKSIASVLSSLDDKIDLLHWQNKTLEALAETLFRQWFLPASAGQAGVEPACPVGRKAEEGWETDTLGNVFDIGIGRTPPRKEQHWFSTNPDDIKWVSIKDMGISGIYIDTTAEYLTQEAVEKFNVPIIPENTVMLSFKMTIGRLAITTERMLSNEAIAHFKQKEKSFLFPEFLYLFLKTYKWEQLGSTSSIVEAINSQMIKEMEIIIPDKQKLNAFKELMKPYFKKIKSNWSDPLQLDTKLKKISKPVGYKMSHEEHDSGRCQFQGYLGYGVY